MPQGIACQRFLSGLCLSIFAALFWCANSLHGVTSETKEDILQDPQFKRGFAVRAAMVPPEGKASDPLYFESAGAILPYGAKDKPVWRLAQWYSHYNLLNATPERLQSGSTRFFDGAKSVTFGESGTSEADLTLALNGRTEWNDVAPSTNSAWPHLIANQALQSSSLSEMKALPFHISYRLLRSDAHRGAGWDERRHTAQFILFLTVRNCNETSSGFGDYLWFGVPMYDARFSVPKEFQARDKGNAKKVGTNKFIFIPNGEKFSTVPAITGDWITVDHDLLPLILKAVESAWSEGFLLDSRDIKDYRLGCITINWEVTGPVDVAMQLRDLRIAQVRSSELSHRDIAR